MEASQPTSQDLPTPTTTTTTATTTNSTMTPVKILSQNMNSHYYVTHAYYKREERINGLIEHLNDYDVVGLQEMFTLNTYFNVAGEELRTRVTNAWKHKHVVVSDPAPVFQQDCGLVILSKYPIVDSQTLFYAKRSPTEVFSWKGALWAKIALPNGQFLEIINTHLDAHTAYMRKTQIAELSQVFIQAKGELQNRQVLAMGDWNVSSVNTDKSLTQEYRDLVSTLKLTALRDKYYIAHEPTYFRRPFCLDHFFFSSRLNVLPQTFAKLRLKSSQQVDISDHNGITVTIQFPTSTVDSEKDD
eukprot:TRINITY_DN1437_c0_g1_i2.p1 TRINITY_DN1437_c0_g1~~TRINITY_DN1437_c0_g1_i2.p1  ORF type:complete len:301 (+),score=67.68 TRINITY_DN1437_c0_g1_i2:69-971(+)